MLENLNFFLELKVLVVLLCVCGLFGWWYLLIKVKNWFCLDFNCYSIKWCIFKMFYGFSVKGVLLLIFYYIYGLDVFVLFFIKI